MTDVDRRILLALDLSPAKREQDALSLGMSVTRMIQRALWLLDDPEALADLPQHVARWRRIREARRGR